MSFAWALTPRSGKSAKPLFLLGRFSLVNYSELCQYEDMEKKKRYKRIILDFYEHRNEYVVV